MPSPPYELRLSCRGTKAQPARFMLAEGAMPERKVKGRARRAKKRGQAPSTQAGEFVREEVHHVREGKHGARSSRQVVAIGLSKARRAGVDVPPPKRGKAAKKTRRSAQRDVARGRGGPVRATSSPRRKRASRTALKREGKGAASREALSKQARRSAARRTPEQRRAAAKKALRTKGQAPRKRWTSRMRATHEGSRRTAP